MAPSVTAPNLATIPTIGAVRGLSTQEAAEWLKKFGSNAIPEPKSHPVRAFLMKFWAPVPWMLEITFILEMALRKPVEAIIIALPLTGNAVLGFIEEGTAHAALEILRHRPGANDWMVCDGVVDSPCRVESADSGLLFGWDIPIIVSGAFVKGVDAPIVMVHLGGCGGMDAVC